MFGFCTRSKFRGEKPHLPKYFVKNNSVMSHWANEKKTEGRIPHNLQTSCKFSVSLQYDLVLLLFYP